MEELSLERKNAAFTLESNNTVMIETGVYFLFQEDKVVYVGGSEDIYRSIATCKNKVFDSWNYISCKKDKLNELIESYTLFYKPRYNTWLRSNTMWISKTQAKKKFGINKNYFNQLVKEGYFQEVSYFTDTYVLVEDIIALGIDHERDNEEDFLDIDDDNPFFMDVI